MSRTARKVIQQRLGDPERTDAALDQTQEEGFGARILLQAVGDKQGADLSPLLFGDHENLDPLAEEDPFPVAERPVPVQPAKLANQGVLPATQCLEGFGKFPSGGR